jgi:glutamate dehydrogenase
VPDDEVAFFLAGVQQVNHQMDALMVGSAREAWQARCEQYRGLGIDDDWVLQLAMPDNLFSGLCVIEAARTASAQISDSARVFYTLHDRLSMDILATRLSDAAVETHWQAVAREAFLDDLESQLRAITVAILQAGPPGQSLELMEAWLAGNTQWLQRWLAMVNEIQTTQPADFALFSVAIRELTGLAHLHRLTGRADGG